MTGLTARGPDGVEWQVGRRRAPRVAGRPGLVSRALRFVTEGGTSGTVTAMLAVCALALAVLVVLPLLSVMVDPGLAAALVLAVVVSRALARRRWLVEAQASDGRRLEYRVVGWKESHRLVDDVAFALSTGRPPPDPGATGQTDIMR